MKNSNSDAKLIRKRIVFLTQFIKSNGITYDYIKRHTGISVPDIKQLLGSLRYDSDDKTENLEIKANYEKFKRLTDILLRFYEKEKYNFTTTLSYHKLPDEEFSALFLALYNELGIRSKEKLANEAKIRLEDWYDSFLELPKVYDGDKIVEEIPTIMGLDLFILSNYPQEMCDDIWTAFSYLSEVRQRINRLKEEICEDEYELKYGVYYCEEDEKKVCFEGYVPVSEEYAAVVRERIERNKKTIKKLEAILKRGDPNIKGSTEAIEAKNQYSSFLVSGYDITERKNKNLAGLHYHNLPTNTSDNSQKKSKKSVKTLSADQQKAILAVMLEKCLDKSGYLRPEHFGSGLYLMSLNVSNCLRSYNWVANRESYTVGTLLPYTDKEDPIRLFLDTHQRVLLKRSFNKEIDSVVKALSEVSTDTSNKVFILLKSKSYLEKLGSEKHQEYYKTLSEYIDLVSETEPFCKNGSYSKEQLYRLVYEMCELSDGQYNFSFKTLHDLQKKLSYTSKDWLWEMYIFSYCSRYKGVKRLISYIKKYEMKQRENKEKEMDI